MSYGCVNIYDNLRKPRRKPMNIRHVCVCIYHVAFHVVVVPTIQLQQYTREQLSRHFNSSNGDGDINTIFVERY